MLEIPVHVSSPAVHRSTEQFAGSSMAELEACVDFLQRLIQTPGLPGEEAAVAELVAAEMQRLGYDEVRVDDAGNVIGRIEGRGEAAPVMFNTHLDHVDVGDPAAWPHPPFGGEIHDGQVWGRGAVDIKGPLAAQLHGVARLTNRPEPPPGDVYVTATVQEEIGGVGARHLVTHLRTPYVVVGEPSSNALRRGHRGRIEPVVHIQGRSAHASAPDRAVNPLEVAARVISSLRQLEMAEDPDLGPSTIAVTQVRTDQESTNVIPSEARMICDWRNVAAESDEDVVAKLQALVDASLIEGASARVDIPAFTRTTYTGMQTEMPASMPPFVTRQEDPALRSAREILREALGQSPREGFWQFATDGGRFAQAGLTVIGFGPGDETLAHTVDERIPIAQLEAAMNGYEALALHWTAATERASSL